MNTNNYNEIIVQALITCENSTCCKDCIYWSVCNDYDTNPISVENFLKEIKKVRINVD